MIQGTTPTVKITFDKLNIDLVDNVIFEFKTEKSELLEKTYPSEEVDYHEGAFKVKFKQIDFNNLQYGKCEYQSTVLFEDGSVGKSKICSFNIDKSLSNKILSDTAGGVEEELLIAQMESVIEVFTGESGAETDPIYTADKPNIATKSELGAYTPKEEFEGLAIAIGTKVDEIEGIITTQQNTINILKTTGSGSKYLSDNGQYKTISIDGGGGDIIEETDPIYLADKPNLALKADLEHIDDMLDSKVDKDTGKGLSTNDFTTLDKNKLNGVESLAQVNKIEKVLVNGIELPITNKAIDVIIGAVFRYKGSKPTFTELPLDAEIGDVWNALSTDDNYVWTGTEWDKLGGTIDLSNYITTQQLTTTLSNYANKNDFEAHEIKPADSLYGHIKLITTTPTYYISKSGNDNNNGLSEATAFLTAERAFKELMTNIPSITLNVNLKFGAGEWGTIIIPKNQYSGVFIDQIRATASSSSDNSEAPIFNTITVYDGRVTLRNLVASRINAYYGSIIIIDGYCKVGSLIASQQGYIRLASTVMDIFQYASVNYFIQAIDNSFVDFMSTTIAFNFTEQCSYSSFIIATNGSKIKMRPITSTGLVPTTSGKTIRALDSCNIFSLVADTPTALLPFANTYSFERGSTFNNAIVT